MKKKILLSILSILATTSALQAQVRGVVKDEAGTPVISATVIWSGTTHGTVTDENGKFSLASNKKSQKIVVSYVGYQPDTITVTRNDELNITLRPLEMEGIEVVGRRLGVVKMRDAVNGVNISAAELSKAACCNLGESFTTSPSVDVSYSDAATGAKQIKLLGLSGTYVQMLTENMPNFRGVAAPYALGYVPGPWMESIQVSKGSASVKNGYEAITGQINVEFKKPQAEEQAINFNMYGDTKKRWEANFDGNIHLGKRWSTALLAHYEDTNEEHDKNEDGFLDSPKVRQYNVQNRWAFMGDRYIFQAGVKALKEDRTGGQSTHSNHSSHISLSPWGDMYSINMETERYEAFAKNAFILNKEKNTNIALMTSGSLHKTDAAYGYKLYDVNQKNAYASLMFETDFTPEHKLSTGVSFNYDYYGQHHRLSQDKTGNIVAQRETETTPGAYAQYTFHGHDRWTIMAGVRIDHSNKYGTFVTPRLHVKYSPHEIISFRASAGKGYRSVYALAENNYLLASGRDLIIDDLKQEEAWNYGISTTLNIPLWGRKLEINAEYYYTDFKNQAVIDYDTNSTQIRIANLDGKSYSHIFQIDATYPVMEDFTITAAYRKNNVKTTYGGVLMEKPLTNRYKGLITGSYKTNLGLWQFDATLQLNGGGRMPTPYLTALGSPSWESSYGSYEQVNMQITRWFRRWSVYIGVENLTGKTQKTTVIDGNNPWGNRFDPTLVWGPVHGRMFYAGFRIGLSK